MRRRRANIEPVVPGFIDMALSFWVTSSPYLPSFYSSTVIYTAVSKVQRSAKHSRAAYEIAIRDRGSLDIYNMIACQFLCVHT
jgi:hypothetical protein